MEFDKFAVLQYEIQKGFADLAAGKVFSGKQVLDDLVFRVAANQGLPEIQGGKTLLLEKVKKHLNLR